MKLLEDRILQDGKVLEGDILKIDSFLNHQVDVGLMEEIGKEFYRLFQNTKPDKILTIEASGIAIAYPVSKCFGNIPLVFAKKTNALNMSHQTYSCTEKSYTRDIIYNVQVSKEYLKEGERVLIIDDFLANGEASSALINLCEQSKANVVGIGIVVSKSYQPGEKKIRSRGYNLQILAKVKSMSNGKIEFEQ